MWAVGLPVTIVGPVKTAEPISCRLDVDSGESKEACGVTMAAPGEYA